MHIRTLQLAVAVFSCATILTLGAIVGCQRLSPRSALTRPAGEPGIGQQLFDTDEQAAAALVVAAKTRDHDALHKLFGPSVAEFISGDKVEDQTHFDRFVKNASEHLQLEKKNAQTSVVDIGKDNWPFPIPITRLANGKWFFDTEAGKQEILDRRIGGNELETIKVCRGYVDAQRQYASVDRDGSSVLKYAQHYISHHGKDGLYWEATAGQEESPFGTLVAQATMEGYTPGQKTGSGPQPFHGYVYRILTCQGPDAPGGDYNYVINGNMIAGFALVACPTEYGTSGVMTFIISHQGKVYQKDLGPKTAQIVGRMTQYNPDSSWTALVSD